MPCGGVTTAVGFPSGPGGRPAARRTGGRNFVVGIARFEIAPFTPAGGSGETLPRRSGLTVNSQRDLFRKFWRISGVTRDKDGNALASCRVELFETQSDAVLYSTTSDAAGAFSFSVPTGGWSWFLRAYKAGSPDLAGTTVDTVTAVLADA
jgi:hypothetical protein